MAWGWADLLTWGHFIYIYIYIYMGLSDELLEPKSKSYLRGPGWLVGQLAGWPAVWLTGCLSGLLADKPAD